MDELKRQLTKKSPEELQKLVIGLMGILVADSAWGLLVHYAEYLAVIASSPVIEEISFTAEWLREVARQAHKEHAQTN
jgi:hypothetical protein